MAGKGAHEADRAGQAYGYRRRRHTRFCAQSSASRTQDGALFPELAPRSWDRRDAASRRSPWRWRRWRRADGIVNLSERRAEEGRFFMRE